MWSVLDSPRRRRRLSIAAVAVGLATPLIYLGVHYSSPGSKGEATGPADAGASYTEPKQVPFTPKKRREVRTVLARFIGTAVARKDVGSSWEVAGPTLRSGMTRDEWRSGDIPVTPYPAVATARAPGTSSTTRTRGRSGSTCSSSRSPPRATPSPPPRSTW